jgi:hypothetical protein
MRVAMMIVTKAYLLQMSKLRLVYCSTILVLCMARVPVNVSAIVLLIHDLVAIPHFSRLRLIIVVTAALPLQALAGRHTGGFF